LNICEICKKEFKNLICLSYHIKAHKISTKEYYDKYLKNNGEGLCSICKNETNFISINRGYRKFCSSECLSKSDDIKNKRKNTMLERYGVENAAQSKFLMDKQRRTCLKNYGYENPSKSEEIKNKKRITCLENYGVENPLQSDKVKEKTKKTMLNKYGVENPFQSEEIKNKIKKTNLKKYNTENLFQSGEIKEKIKKTNFNKMLEKIINLFNFLNLELISNYKHSRESIKLKCLKCNTIFETNYFYIQQGYGKCPNCFPKYKSIEENKINYFVKSFNFKIIENSRDIISPYELDLYIPDEKLAIEFNGLYWHSEQFKTKNYHLNKTESCEKQDIKLIHIFEDEWILKKEIIKSKLKQLLNLNKDIKRIHARKCRIKEISPKVKNEFLNRYHIQGEDKSVVKLGAFYGNELVSVMTFSHGSISRKKLNENNWELSRFCSNSNYHIPGIASKLLTYFKRNYEWNEIFSYADRRWSEGNLYYKIGFELDSITKPNYWYVKNGIRIHRFNLRKKYNEPKDVPEWVLRSEEGYCRIWDCGHFKFIMRK